MAALQTCPKCGALAFHFEGRCEECGESLQATTYKSDPPRSLTEDHYLPPATAQTVVTNDDYHQQVA